MPVKHKLPCRSVDPEIFFPVGFSGPALAQAELAKTICIPCPILAECLNYALANAIEFGVWGGMSEQERRALLRRQPINRPARRNPRETHQTLVRELASA
jgi:WhiB family redox-sensing transcriptional regulator